MTFVMWGINGRCSMSLLQALISTFLCVICCHCRALGNQLLHLQCSVLWCPLHRNINTSPYIDLTYYVCANSLHLQLCTVHRKAICWVMVWEGGGLRTFESGVAYLEGTHSLPRGVGSTILAPLGTVYIHNRKCDHTYREMISKDYLTNRDKSSLYDFTSSGRCFSSDVTILTCEQLLHDSTALTPTCTGKRMVILTLLRFSQLQLNYIMSPPTCTE